MQYSIHIPKVLERSYGATQKMGPVLLDNQFHHVALFMGIGIYDMFGKKIIETLSQEKDLSIVLSEEYEEMDAALLMKKAYSLPKNIDCIIGIGGGKGIDSAKYMAFLNNLPFISVPTSISNDGFSSSGSSLMMDGKRVSVKSTMPVGIIADLEILQNAPEKFFYSGLGDIVAKVPALYDWEREGRLSGVSVNHFAAMIAKKSVNSVVRLPFKYIREGLMITEVIDSLIMSGISMEIAGNSAPASGSEHLISHALDLILEKPCLHGIQVGIASYMMSIVQEHRSQRIETFLSETGFFEFSKGFHLKKQDFAKAIEMAPSIKPNRNTYLHDEGYRNKALELLESNKILGEILV